MLCLFLWHDTTQIEQLLSTANVFYAVFRALF